MRPPEKMAGFWTSSAFERLTGGRWHPRPPPQPLAIAGVSIDTRTLRPGEAFFAIRGERFDGHDFIDQAATAGAVMAVVESRGSAAALAAHLPRLVVPNAVAALQGLARAYREALRERAVSVIAVAGSNGKTTTRHLVHTALAARLAGTQSPKSFNNHLGVPLTLLGAAIAGRPLAGARDPSTGEPLRLPRDDDFVLVEVGTNRPGEIAALARLVQPDAVVITSIGAEHLEALGDLAGVAREEGAVLQHLTGERRVFISEQARAHLESEGTGYPTEPVIYDRDRVRRVTPTGDGQRVELASGTTVTLPLPGRHNVSNALAAVAVAQWMGVPEADAWSALETAAAAPMRMERVIVAAPGAPVVVLNDAYNANFHSMLAALETLREYPGAHRRIAVLGDMLELGAQGPELHRALGRELRADRAILIGELAACIAEGVAEGESGPSCEVHPEWSEGLAQRVAASLEPGDVVLIKASRGMQLERLVPAIEARFAPGSSAPPGG